MKIFLEIWILFKHYMLVSLRSPIWIFVALFQPCCYLFFYAPLLSGFLEKTGSSKEEALKIFTPGLLVMLAIFGTMFVGFALIDDLRTGVIERFRVTPIHRVSLLIGRTLRDVVTLLLQSAILLVLALTLGLKVSLLATFLLLGFMMLVGFFVAPLSYSLALTLKSEDGVGSVINFFAQPMILLSGILLPLNFAPTWLKGLSYINPLNYIVNATRLVFSGDIANPGVYQGIIVLLFLIGLVLAWGASSFNNALE